MQELITLIGHQDSSSVDTPIQVNLKYSKKETNILPNPTLYMKLVESLNYRTGHISYAVQQVCQFMQEPRHIHLAAIVISFNICMAHQIGLY